MGAKRKVEKKKNDRQTNLLLQLLSEQRKELKRRKDPSYFGQHQLILTIRAILHHTHLILHKGDILDPHCSVKILSEVRPKEIYHLAAQSHVTSSFEIPEYTFQVNVFGTLNLLQAIRLSGIENTTRLYNGNKSPAEITQINIKNKVNFSCISRLTCEV